MGLCQQAWLSTTPSIAQLCFVGQRLTVAMTARRMALARFSCCSFAPALEPTKALCQAQKLHVGSSSVIYSSHKLALFLISHVALGKSFNRSWCPP